MPGLSQLKKFKSDLLSLGDEVTIRASRGEKPVDIVIPKEVEDKDDSEDFVLGMPEIEAAPEETEVDDDLSDLTGIVQNSKNSESSEEPAPSFAAPDLSSLLTPMAEDSAENIPDLSMFEEQEEEPVEEVEEEPEEVSIADMGLEALLAGGGFDEPEQPEPEEETEPESEELPSADDLNLSENFSTDNYDFPELAAFVDTKGGSSDIEDLTAADDDLSNVEDLTAADDDLSDVEDLSPADELSSAEEISTFDDLDSAADDLSSFGNLPTLDDLTAADETPISDLHSADSDLPSLDGTAEEIPTLDDLDFVAENASVSDLSAADDMPSLDDLLPPEDSTIEPQSSAEEIPSLDDFSLPEDFAASEDFSAGENPSDTEDFSAATDLSATDDFSLPEDFSVDANPSDTEDFSAPSEPLPSQDSEKSATLEPLDAGIDLSDLGLEIEETNIDTSKELQCEQKEKSNGIEKSDGFDYGFDSFDVPGFIDVDALDDENQKEDESAESDVLNENPVEEESAVEDVAPAEILPQEENNVLDSLDDFSLPENLDDIGTTDSLNSEEDIPTFDSADSSDTFDSGLENLTDGLDNLVDSLGADTDFGADDSLGTDSALGTDDSLGTDSVSEPDIFAESDGTLENLDFDLPDISSDNSFESPSADSSLENFSLDDLDNAGSDETSETPDNSSAEDNPDIPGDLLAGMDLDLDSIPSESSESGGVSDFDTSGLDDFDFGTDSNSSAAGEDSNASDDFSSMDFSTEDFSGGEGIPDYSEDISEFDNSDSQEENSDSQADGDSAPLEVFDTSEMDGLDFGIPDTDSTLGNGPDFELGGNDDFSMEGEFEIPGFSDVDTVKEEKRAPKSAAKNQKGSKGKNLPEPDFSDAQESEELPPNTLSDSQYKTFLKNLSEYPLNVRLAFEDLIVQDEFTDDAEFEIIEKILNKAPARQIASMLEKMLDISIPVPRDFEHRTAEEYEAYKKSLSYQLRNKIIPGALVAALLVLVGWGLFNFTRSCIYRPLVANKYYKQGYVLLEASEYPQSEISFNKAVSYRINKKWFFRYARGYREHKQYQRAAGMYQKILAYYKHNKEAGLEYADMELNDLANYERAEEIVRREILDYHINDADGILKLGDVFLEWGTEKDSSKLELAREQYATLLQLYKPNDLYLSRMLRYFIRTDNLLEVLQLQQNFTKEKQLSSDDWTELSGYLLDKYYGPLSPSQEYLRYEIEGLRAMLIRAVKTNPENPIALYNLSKYYVKTNENEFVERTLQSSIEKFNSVESIKRRDLYKYIDAYKLLGEHYVSTADYLKAQEQFAEGISLYATERDNAGFEGNEEIGKLYEDMGNIKYSVSGDLDQALSNYTQSVALENDTPSIRYRIGYIQYKNKNYAEALGSFMKAGDGNVKERNLLLAMANTLSLRNDDYAAQGYYNQLIDTLDSEIAENGIVFPQANETDYDIVNTYLRAANNYGVTLYRLAKRTGNSALNAQSIVQFSQSVRAWDALTRNQETMKRLEGSNLAEQNIKYITNPIPQFEPSIYIDISKTLTDSEKL